VSIPLASQTLVLFPAVNAVESITSQLESKLFTSPRTSKKCQRNASPAEPRPKPPLLILPARVGIPLLRLLLVVGVVVLMVLLLPLRSMPRISGPVRAGLGLPNQVISRREHPRRTKVPSDIGYPQDCPISLCLMTIRHLCLSRDGIMPSLLG
jgi:hypothetical protein